MPKNFPKICWKTPKKFLYYTCSKLVKMFKDQELIELGFQRQEETAENSGAPEDWYYYTLDVGDICLITDGSDEGKDTFKVSLLEHETIEFQTYKALKAFIDIIRENTV